MIDHDIDPVAPEGFLPFAAVDGEVHSRQPFEARYTFTADEETLTLTVEGDLAVVDVTKNRASRPDRFVHRIRQHSKTTSGPNISV